MKSGYAYYTDYNTFDGNGIIGRIPAYGNIYVAAGFGENGKFIVIDWAMPQ